MAVRKPCRSRGCKASPRCEHPWWLDVMHNRQRYRMPVDDFALARGAKAPVTSKQEAEKVWEPKFIAEIVSGKDPRVPIERETKLTRPTTVADLLALYRARYVEVEPLKSRAGMRSQLKVLSEHLGNLPASALERPDAIEEFKARYAKRAIATTNRYLARLRHVSNWAIGRDLLSKTAFHRRGVRIPAKAERRRERRVSEAEEQRLLDACKLLNEPTRSMAKLTWDDVRDIRAQAQAGVEQKDVAAAFKISQSVCSAIVRGHIWDPAVKVTTGDEMHDRIVSALDTGCRRGEMLKIQNKQVDWRHRWIRILKEHSKTDVARVIPFEAGSRLSKILRRRSFLGPDAYVFGEARTRRVRGDSQVSVGDVAASGERHQAGARGQWQAGVEPEGARADRSPLARPPARGVVTVGRRWRSRSRAAVARRARQHHHDAALHERSRELAGRVDAPGESTASEAVGRRRRSSR